VVATHAPPPAAVPFRVQEKALASTDGRPLARSELSALRTSSSIARAPSFPVRAATAPAANGRGLVPARPDVPATQPVQSAGFARRVTTSTFSSRVEPTAPASTQAERVAAPAAKTPLDQSYETQRAQMEARHQQEFAAPSVAQRPAQMQQLSQRQETEHAQLDQQYHAAKQSGATTMPARSEPARPASPPPAAHHRP
jgi:hypothetical protein